MQMMEHMFRPHDIEWNAMCKEFYTSPHPLISISKWNIEALQKDYGRTAPTHYVGNGVNLNDFPIEHQEKDGKTVLVEGWEGYNPTKDVEHIGPKVAYRLKQDGYKIIAYGQVPIKFYPLVPDKYYLCPDLKTLNYIYSKATIMIKASRYDARSCAPMESMTKGTVTARAIIDGDDDLIGGRNCAKVGYTEHELYGAALMLLRNSDTRKMMADNCRKHVLDFSWQYWMEKINEILIS